MYYTSKRPVIFKQTNKKPTTKSNMRQKSKIPLCFYCGFLMHGFLTIRAVSIPGCLLWIMLTSTQIVLLLFQQKMNLSPLWTSSSRILLIEHFLKIPHSPVQVQKEIQCIQGENNHILAYISIVLIICP